MVRRYLINPVRRWLGLSVHYRMRCKTGYLRWGS